MRRFLSSMGKKLVVYIPGIGIKAKTWEPLVTRLKDELRNDPEFGEAEWVGWDHDCHPFSFGSMLSIAQRFCDWLDARWFVAGGYDEIILIGHSIGGIIVRQAYLLSAGVGENRPKSEWWRKVSRFVLLAAVNRGIKPNKPLIKLYDLLLELTSLLFCRRKMVGRDSMFGSEFITNLRLQWIAFMNKLPNEERPTVAQILSKDDGIVSRDDSVDLEQFPDAYHIPIPDVKHADLPRIHKGKDPEMRYQIIRDIVTGRRLAERADEIKPPPRKQNVVFILHGIRASNRGWVSQLSDLVNSTLPDVEVVPSSYGYLSALEFVIPWLHRRPLRWFQSKYADYFATYPKANFYFVGHSNGTYILGHSLLALSGMHFKRIILAGSVLPQNYPWRQIFKRGQYEELRNDQANKDLPVGFLCSGLNGLGRRDLGTAGYEGFGDDDNSIVQYAFHDGDHGAALQSTNLVSFLDFLVNGTQSSKPACLVEEQEQFSLLSRMAPWIFRILVLALVAWAAFVIAAQFFVGGLIFVAILGALALILKVL